MNDINPPEDDDDDNNGTRHNPIKANFAIYCGNVIEASLSE